LIGVIHRLVAGLGLPHGLNSWIHVGVFEVQRRTLHVRGCLSSSATATTDGFHAREAQAGTSDDKRQHPQHNQGCNGNTHDGCDLAGGLGHASVPGASIEPNITGVESCCSCVGVIKIHLGDGEKKPGNFWFI